MSELPTIIGVSIATLAQSTLYSSYSSLHHLVLDTLQGSFLLKKMHSWQDNVLHEQTILFFQPRLHFHYMQFQKSHL